MSFELPKQLPDFRSAGRRIENDLWRSVHGDRGDELPLYKDKPYGVDFRHPQSSRRRRKQIFIGVIVGLFFFLIYRFGRSHVDGEVDSSSLFSSWRDQAGGKPDWKQRQNAVRQVFKQSWAGYEKYAWGQDLYKPVTQKGKNMGPKPLGWIIVDSIDTLLIMGLEEEEARARNWVKNELDYDMDYAVNTFETTIRMLGGLLSAFYLSEDDMYLDKAVDLANRLLGAFDSHSGIPYASVNLRTGKGIKSHTDGGASSTAEAATLQLEFKYLSKVTGEALFWEKAEKVIQAIDNNHMEGGLVPIFIQPDTGKFSNSLIRMGSRGDSYYEYLSKMYLQTMNQEPIYKEMYDEVVEGINKYLISHSEPNKLTFIGELNLGVGDQLSPKMDHLVCFAGGMFALGATEGLTIDQARRRLNWTNAQENQMTTAMELTRTCYETYKQTSTGLGPEIVFFNTDPAGTADFYIKPFDSFNLQRPETVESLFVLWRITRNPVYREWGWEIFKSFEKWSKVNGDGGFACLENVNQIPPAFRDNMESFWLAETLKYLYLLFDDSSDDLLSLEDVVFNTEAHPFPKFSMDPLFKTGWTRTNPAEEDTTEPSQVETNPTEGIDSILEPDPKDIHH